MKKILIVEDEFLGRSIGKYLSKRGYEILLARNGKEALEKLANNKVDIVITDMILSYTNGVQIIKEAEKQKIPVIVVTNVKDEDTVTGAFFAGACDYMTKPISLFELEIRIKKCLDTYVSCPLDIDSPEGKISRDRFGRARKDKKSEEK